MNFANFYFLFFTLFFSYFSYLWDTNSYFSATRILFFGDS